MSQVAARESFPRFLRAFYFHLFPNLFDIWLLEGLVYVSIFQRCLFHLYGPPFSYPFCITVVDKLVLTEMRESGGDGVVPPL